MKKDREKLINLIKNKKLSNTEISRLTGYHPKSIIRIKKEMYNNTYLTNKRKISIDEKNLIITSAKKFNNISEYYKHYKDNNLGSRSYSSIYNILRTDIEIPNYVIIGNIKSNDSFAVQYYAFDYASNQLLYLVNKYGDSFTNYLNIIKYISFKYGIPNDIYCYGNSFLKYKNSNKYLLFNNMCLEYSINIITSYNHKLSSIIKKIEDKIIHHKLFIANNISNLSDNKALIKHIVIDIAKRKVLNDNTVEYDNVIYQIESNNLLSKNEATLYFYDDQSFPNVQINNIIYSTTIIKKKESKKKY